MSVADSVLYTIGHSTHSIEKFLGLLQAQGITAVADVRSSPFSRYNPQFNQENLHQALRHNGIHYVFLGRELGARSEDPRCYESGRVVYGRLADSPLFQQGVQRVRQGMAAHKIALLCAEKDPLTCHRTILISRRLARDGVSVCHILEDGSLENQQEAEERLLRQHQLHEPSLFDTLEERIAEAYRRQEERIAYVSPDSTDI